MSSTTSINLSDKGFPTKVIEEVSPFLLPETHIAYSFLKQLGPETLPVNNLREMGFTKWKQGGTVMLMIHEKLPGFVIKLPLSHLANEPRLGVTRVKSHFYANRYLEDKKVKGVKASKNWLFPVKCDPKDAERYEKFCQQKESLKQRDKFFSNDYFLQKIAANSIFFNSFLVIEERLELLSGGAKKRALGTLLNIKMIDVIENFLLYVGESDIYLQNVEVTKDQELAFIDLTGWKKKDEARIQNGILGFGNLLFIADNEAKKCWSQKTISLFLTKATDLTVSKAMALNFVNKEQAHKSYVSEEIWQELLKKISSADRELIDD